MKRKTRTREISSRMSANLLWKHAAEKRDDFTEALRAYNDSPGNSECDDLQNAHDQLIKVLDAIKEQATRETINMIADQTFTF